MKSVNLTMWDAIRAKIANPVLFGYVLVYPDGSREPVKPSQLPMLAKSRVVGKDGEVHYLV